MGFIFCKDKKTLTALEGMSESSPPTTHAYFAHMYADIQTGKKMSITFPFCFIADGQLLVLLPLIMIDAQILPLLPIGLLFALFSLSVRLSLWLSSLALHLYLTLIFGRTQFGRL